jgi:hypothetical protein
MRKFHSIAALCGDGLRPELQALFERLAIDPYTELFVRPDGMVQSGPDPKSEPSQWPNENQSERLRQKGRQTRLHSHGAGLSIAIRASASMRGRTTAY